MFGIESRKEEVISLDFITELPERQNATAGHGVTSVNTDSEVSESPTTQERSVVRMSRDLPLPAIRPLIIEYFSAERELFGCRVNRMVCREP